MTVGVLFLIIVLGIFITCRSVMWGVYAVDQIFGLDLGMDKPDLFKFLKHTDYLSSISSQPKLTYDQWWTFYTINPDKWKPIKQAGSVWGMMYTPNGTVYCMATYKDYKKLLKLEEDAEKKRIAENTRKRDIAHCEQLVELCELVKADAKAQEEQAKQECKETIERMLQN